MSRLLERYRRLAWCFATLYTFFGNWRIDNDRRAQTVPRKVRELVEDLQKAGFFAISSGGKGSHRKFVHPNYPGAVTLSGKSGDDAKPYQERQVKHAIEQVQG